MSTIQVIAKFTIKEGNIDEFKRIGAEGFALVQATESGTLQYDWFFGADPSTCVVFEKYADSTGLIQHITNVRVILGQLLKLSTVSLEVYGDLSPELTTMVVSFGAKVFAPVMVLQR